MRKAFLVLALTGLIVGTAGGAQAHVQFFDLDAALVDQGVICHGVCPDGANGPEGVVTAVTGGIRCTAGEVFVIQGVVTDQEGNTAGFQAQGECTGSHQQWFTENVDSETGFSCEEPILGVGRTGSIGGGGHAHGFRWQQQATTACPLL